MTVAPHQLRLYLVADPEHTTVPLVEAVETAVRNGVTAVQLRAKRLDDRTLLNAARSLQAICHDQNVRFLVNDRVDIALLADADGVHVGVSDVTPADIRTLAPPGFIIGYSPDSSDDPATGAADYLGVGPVFGTASKADAGMALGTSEFRNRVESAGVPVVGIGGITSGNARSVIEAGASGVAVISAILGSDDIGSATRRLREVLEMDAP